MYQRLRLPLLSALGLGRAVFLAGLPLVGGCAAHGTPHTDTDVADTDTDVTSATDDTSGGDTNDSDTAADAVLTGTLGDLGPLQPIVAANVIEYSGETITYLSTVPLPCDAMATSRWLGSLDPNAQIVEIVYKSATTDPHLVVGGNGSLEVNYAKGGRSSSYEVNAASGTATITEHTSGGPISGVVDATYDNPAGSLHGPFAADFCPGGQEY